jgi:L-lactate dehydrogenase complex protein LldF
LSSLGARLLARLAGKQGRLHWLPFVNGWTQSRDLPAPHEDTFMQLYRKRRGKHS